MKLDPKIGRSLKKASPTILTCIGAAGVVATAVLAVKATPKADSLIKADSRRNHDGDPYAATKLEAVKSCWKCYIPAAATGIATIICIFGANTLNKKQQASLASAYALVNRSYSDYKHKLKELYGEDAHKKIMESIAAEKSSMPPITATGGFSNSSLEFEDANEEQRLFYDSFSKRYFQATISQVMQAEYHINRNMVLGAFVTLNDFYDFLGISHVEGGDVVGWLLSDSMYWIDFDNSKAIKNNTEDELQEMANTAQKVLTEAGWDETGKQIVKGLTEGVQSEKSSFVDEITQLALAGVQAAKSTLDINSPSRVFREIGNYTGLGFVKGLQDYVDRSYAAGSEMAESAKGGLSGMLQTIADIVSGGFDMEPVIRPVLDLSAVSAGADALNNLFYSQRAVGLVGQAAVAFEAQRGGSSQTTISVDNDDVVAELRTLRGEMASMLERMEKLRVVLNTGALVGELAEPMDVALGQRSTQRGRGI